MIDKVLKESKHSDKVIDSLLQVISAQSTLLKENDLYSAEVEHVLHLCYICITW